ncbi:hypothetical protein [Streptomyces sp. NBC_00648]|uniref:hypothetical protein n=1 Tax=Streptomyces sp. NBC_00648 TaxID=2975797 RepID=UPI002F910844
MRGRASRRITATAVSAAMLFGVAGATGTAMAAEQPEERPVVAPAEAPVPGADALLAQVQSLADMGTVLTPVTDLLNAALKADNGQLSPAVAATLGDEVKAAIAKISAAAPAQPAPVPVTPPATPAVPTTPALPTKPSEAALNGARGAKAQLDLKADALAALQKAVTDLVAAVTAAPPDPAKVVAAVTGTLTSLVGVVVAIVLGGGLPVPNLPGLPPLPKLPVPELPKPPLPLPALPGLPVS